jgi:DNA-binding transcriptional ArsR family regulator
VAAASLDLVFQALADPHRRGMVERLGRGAASAKALGQPLRLALPSAVKHLQVLEASGLVRSEKVGRVRTYELRPQALQAIEAWVAARKRGIDLAFDRLEQAMRDEDEKR